MRDYKELINCIIFTMLLSLSITSHLISYRFVEFMGFVIIPSSLTYMACFVLIDILATFNNRSFLVMVMLCEAFWNLLMICITNVVTDLPHPDILVKNQAFHDVFKPISTMYWANLFGAFTSLLLNFFIFTWLYKNKCISFFWSSVMSSSLVIMIYTITTDILAFYDMYPLNWAEITTTNIVTNILFLVTFSMPVKRLVVLLSKLNGVYDD